MLDFIKDALNTLAGPVATVVDLAGDALGLPPLLTQSIKTAAGAMTGNVMMAASGMAGVASELTKNPPAQTEFCPSQDGAPMGAGYASPRPSAPVSSRAGPLDPLAVSYRDALSTLAANFSVFDTLQSQKNDGRFNVRTLQEAAANPRLSPELRDAARFFLQHPEYRHVVDTANKGGKPDGTLSQQDIQKALKKVNEDLALQGGGWASPTPGAPPVARPPPSGQPWGPGNCAPPPAPLPRPMPGCGESGNLRDILDNPNMGMEEKLQAILMAITRDTDDELLGVMSEMASLREERATLGSKDPTRAAKLETSMEQLNLRLQKLMEKRKQMFELMSTLSSKFNEMAKTAIQNMGRA
ncbi:hypothetical protein POL68_15265 [Stigmatella sp. ncwal1]|uniref:Uncharacterized protein n=1 Tax=Stigmatella ashevillensis TaxID=2995309 RepID=A0ABT5DBX5_9BACT|nr:hypothetical protein [Stigmatella ashevillena]MDC0709831.1 hypothetical protein [Stigmatella ashevillena]